MAHCLNTGTCRTSKQQKAGGEGYGKLDQNCQ